MKESAASVMALILLVGCNAPPPMNLASPYGATRVPPPGTGSFARPDSYYQPSSRPGLSGEGTGAQYAGGELPKSPASGVSVAPAPQNGQNTSAGSGVRLASMEDTVSTTGSSSTGRTTKPVNVTSSEPAIRIVESPAAARTSSPQLKGMAVSDATRPAEPRAFQPSSQMKDLSQYPLTAAAPSMAGTSQAAPTTSAPPANGSDASSWKNRENGSASAVTGR